MLHLKRSQNHSFNMPRSDAIKLYAYSHLSILVATILFNSRNIFDFQLGRNKKKNKTQQQQEQWNPKNTRVQKLSTVIKFHSLKLRQAH